LTPIDTTNDRESKMKKIKANQRRLALKKETIRTLGDSELAVASAGWECSGTGSGNIKCSPFAATDPAAQAIS
jgi:hypothetical protein